MARWGRLQGLSLITGQRAALLSARQCQEPPTEPGRASDGLSLVLYTTFAEGGAVLTVDPGQHTSAITHSTRGSLPSGKKTRAWALNCHPPNKLPYPRNLAAQRICHLHYEVQHHSGPCPVTNLVLNFSPGIRCVLGKARILPMLHTLPITPLENRPKPVPCPAACY